MKLGILFISSVALLGGCASTQTDDGTLASGDDSNKVECRRVERLGSNLGDRVCMTRSEWAAHEKAERQANEEFLSRNSRAGRNESAPSGFGN